MSFSKIRTFNKYLNRIAFNNPKAYQRVPAKIVSGVTQYTDNLLGLTKSRLSGQLAGLSSLNKQQFGKNKPVRERLLKIENAHKISADASKKTRMLTAGAAGGLYLGHVINKKLKESQTDPYSNYDYYSTMAGSNTI